MLFDAKQFEQHFDEKSLKKGLRLFERPAIELLERHANSEFRFMISGAELFLRKRGDRILSYRCSCNKRFYCEHLCAALFFLQQENLGIEARKKITSGTKARKENSKKISSGELQSFIRSAGKTSAGSQAVKQIMACREEACFEQYRALFITLLEPWYISGNLDQKNIDNAYASFVAFGEKIRSLRFYYNAWYYFNLAFLTEMQKFMQLRFTGDEHKLKELVETCTRHLDELFLKGLAPKEKAAWQEAVLLSLRSNSIIRSGGYSFLLPRLLSWLHSKPVFAELNTLLARRKNKTAYHTKLNPLTIAKLQVEAREEAVLKPGHVRKPVLHPVEDIVAKAGLACCSQKILKGFKLLVSGYVSVLKSHREYFEEYTAFAIHKARPFKNSSSK